MTLYEADAFRKKVRISFKNDTAPVIGVIDYVISDVDAIDGRAFGCIGKYEFYEDEIESIELAESE